MPSGVTYYVVREVGGAMRDFAIHRVFDSAVACLQKVIRQFETEIGFDLFGISTDEYGIVTMEWLIYSYRVGERVIQCHGHPAVTRDYVFRQPGAPLRAPSSSLPHSEYIAARRTGSGLLPLPSPPPSPGSADTGASYPPSPPRLAEI
jgi:hypothetical protein